MIFICDPWVYTSELCHEGLGQHNVCYNIHISALLIQGLPRAQLCLCGFLIFLRTQVIVKN